MLRNKGPRTEKRKEANRIYINLSNQSAVESSTGR